MSFSLFHIFLSTENQKDAYKTINNSETFFA